VGKFPYNKVEELTQRQKGEEKEVHRGIIVTGFGKQGVCCELFHS
jgi:hypothetical protein